MKVIFLRKYFLENIIIKYHIGCQVLVFDFLLQYWNHLDALLISYIIFFISNKIREPKSDKI